MRDVAPQVSTDSVRPPDVVVLVETDVADPGRGPALVAAGTAHLSVVVREADTVVGPLVVPGDGPCLRCLDLHRADADPAWPTLAGQLRGSATAGRARRHGCRRLRARHRRGARPPRRCRRQPAGTTFEVAAPDAIPRERTWAVHPDCGCTALRPSRSRQAAGAASLRGRPRHVGRDDHTADEDLAAQTPQGSARSRAPPGIPRSAGTHGTGPWPAPPVPSARRTRARGRSTGMG